MSDRLGTVTVATPSSSPSVQLDGDEDAYPTANGLPGWAPTVGERVFVQVVNNRRQRVVGVL